MKTWPVVIEATAQQDWRGYIAHIAAHYGLQPARNTHDDFVATIRELELCAGSLALYYEVPLLAAMGYRRINFVNGHRYYLLYRIVGDEAVVEFAAHFRRSAQRVVTEPRK